MGIELLADTLLSHYRIVSKLGAGGMGVVYLAQDIDLDRQVAIKLLKETYSKDAEKLNRFLQEAKTASALNHPNILTVYEIGSHENTRYLATELIKGTTLRERMRGEPLKLSEALEISLQVAAALDAAHAVGIIHRDIKPENIMVRHDGLVKVLDFGLAKLTEAGALSARPAASEDETRVQIQTEPGKIMGTIAYMSPEQARGKKIDARSDIFSLGILMFELFTGRRPFEGESQLDLVSSILKDEPSPLSQVSSDLPRELERIVTKALRKDRDHRYQHIQDLHIDLEDLRDELKAEAKLNKTVEPTISGSVRDTNSNPAGTTNSETLRSAFTTSIATRRFTVLHFLAFAVIAAGVIGGIWSYYSQSRAGNVDPGSFKSVEVASWTSAAGELYTRGSFSPDGKLIGFSSTKSGTKNIWVTQTGSTDAIQITNDEFSNIDPIWSPKGDEIAYFSQRPPNPGGRVSYGVWRVPALGGAPRFVGPVPGGITLRRWTASGRIYYGQGSNLYYIDPASGASQQVATVAQENARWLHISADERKIMFSTYAGNEWKLFIRDLQQGEPREIAGGSGVLDGFVWAAGKDRASYSATFNGVMQVFVVDLGTRATQRLTAAETDAGVLDISPDGKSILFFSANEESNLWRTQVSDGREIPLARDVTAKLWPVVSRDNNYVAFQSARFMSNGNKLLEGAIVVRGVAHTSESDKATILAERGYLPSWSRDSSTLAFLRKEGNLSELYTVNASGGGERKLETGGIAIPAYSVSPYNHVHARPFDWSPDDARIAYVGEHGAVSNVHTVGRRDNVVTNYTLNEDKNLLFFSPVWSSDGKRLAVGFAPRRTVDGVRPNRGIRVVDLETGVNTDIYETDQYVRLLGWTPDERGLIIGETDRQAGLGPDVLLKRVSLNGESSELTRLKNVYVYNMFLSYDRKSIAYAAREGNMDDIWVLPATGGRARRLTSNNDSGIYFSRLSWFPDGSGIAFGKQTRFTLLSMIADIE